MVDITKDEKDLEKKHKERNKTEGEREDGILQVRQILCRQDKREKNIKWRKCVKR
jgi:hypothetical protein